MRKTIVLAVAAILGFSSSAFAMGGGMGGMGGYGGGGGGGMRSSAG